MAADSLDAWPWCLSNRLPGRIGNGVCTRPQGHDGPHAASFRNRGPVIMWEQVAS